MKPKPPQRALQFLRWFCREDYLEEFEGDLIELFEKYHEESPRKARRKFFWGVLRCFRPGFIKKFNQVNHSNKVAMLNSHFKIGFRNLIKNKGYSIVNIGGLAVGMAVTILIGLWIWSELSFDKHFKNHDSLAQAWQFVTFDTEKVPYNSLPIPLAEELRDNYPDFEKVSLSTYTREVVLATEDKKLMRAGNYVEPDFSEMFGLNMIKGSREGLNELNSILLSGILAKDLFGEENPIGQIIRINDTMDVKVTGVYEDFPKNSSFQDVTFLAPWDLFITTDQKAKNSQQEWDENSYQIFVQMKKSVDLAEVSTKIRDIRMQKDYPPPYKPEFFLHPMSKWHLHSEFKNGKNAGGLIQFVWLFGTIGFFVLMLACINFMNLATARSEKRAKEVGIRKSIGSRRGQIAIQFLCESFLVVFFGVVLSLILAQLILPFFNEVANKEIGIMWSNPWFWTALLIFILLTGLLAGTYPALYLSSFAPVKALKGTFKVTRFVSFFRKALVVFQFAVSIVLMIGIAVVFKQIDFAKNRPTGYDRNNLIEIPINNARLRDSYLGLRTDLLNSGAVSEVSALVGSVTDDFGGTTALSWEGKTPDTRPLLMGNRVTHEFGKTVDWQVIAGRDFSRDFATDDKAMIVNESAAKLMGFDNPVDQIVRHNGKEFRVIGMVKNMIKESPFKPVKPSFFILDYATTTTINIRLKDELAINKTLTEVEAVFKAHDPNSPFEFNFVNQEYENKFSQEQRIGKLSGFFTILAIFISCLGIFGLASFVAEQRTKEMGVRKVLGASVFNLWKLLSKGFVKPILIAILISAPLAYYFMNNWLQQYEYRIEMKWWMFVGSALVALLITILTVSYQSLKAATVNPINGLRAE